MMGKARKHLRGKSSGFAPDYMQAVETMIEPDEFGYPHGIDSEIEEAPALKRSRFSLNGDSYGVPKEVLSFSKMSRSERKNLVHKLKMELEQVRDLRKRIACISSDTVLLSPYGDIRSYSDGSKRPPQENFATFVGTQGKKRCPVRNDKQRTKKGPSRHSESARLDVATSSTVASVMKECQTLLDRVWSHKLGFAFRNPVDPVLLNIPDYFTVIKHPMDLGTIRSRLRNDEYSSPLDFAADVRLTFSNSIAYNPPGNQYHKMARDLSAYFESRWKAIEKKIPVTEPPVMPLASSASLEAEIPYKVAPPRKKAAAVNESKLRVEPAKLVMTDGEKKQLSRDLEALEEEFPQNIVDLLREQSGIDGQSGEVEIEIDIDTLSDEILFMVRKLLDDYLREKKKSQEKSEPCEMEIVHDSGFSNSSLQPSKGDLLIDEDVDIVGGNDPPVSSHPPLQIEKDAACRNNECSSLSSSSSESGSSSTDSDSFSSSGNETDSIKASNPTNTEDKKEPGVGINRKDENINGEKIVVNDSLVEHDVGENSTAMDAVPVLPEEETAPPDPEKRYRAALLKNRFADTIMKAREKALTKGEKGDPEKLRIEREEFEKRLRQEKVRLQAEAKAADEARRKAKQSCRKARREREQRGCCTTGFTNMEKTVEINEGRRFMEDLEMLRATVTDGDQLPTFMEEMSPKCSQDMLGSFKMEGNSNPLEQLGLYMKMDEDEDDEEDQPHFSQVDEQSIDRKERRTLSPDEVEREDLLVSGNEKPDNENHHEDEKLISQNEGKKQSENVPEQENGVEDKGEQETEVVDKGDEEALVVDKGDEEAVVVDKGDEEAEVVDKREEEREVVDMVEVETEVVDKVEQETEVIDKGEQEQGTKTDDMGEQTIEVGNEREQETELLDKREEDSEVMGKGELETEIVDKGEQETEVIDKGEQEQEQETKIDDMEEQKTVVVDNGEQVIEVVNEREQETELLDKREEDSDVVGKGEQENEVVEEEID
ncbi:hypothetical protein EUTSA_v10003590mg [Eutrema salsugineum]|uniref:Bromo domain-containing protein n=1 Tax=Eutrema salsugineum TaxID=72664 RepID=V4K126_EUTSA|nr:hypothetical protein EUTSA_v10003590mg [Eutrema salsugineum]